MGLALYEKDTERRIGSITEEQLRILMEFLEEEYDEDRDYYITPDTLAFLEEHDIEPDLLELLRNALGEQEGIEVLWRRD